MIKNVDLKICINVYISKAFIFRIIVKMKDRRTGRRGLSEN